MRALPKDDGYRLAIKGGMAEDDWNLEQWSGNTKDVPMVCVSQAVEHDGARLRMDELIRLGEKSGLAREYVDLRTVYWIDRPVAMFARLSNPLRLNVVLHQLNFLRTGREPEILHEFDIGGMPTYVESRKDFCKLLTRFGRWSTDRADRTVQFGSWCDDLRLSPPHCVLEDAKALVNSWGMRRTYSVAFKRLSDEEFVQTVVEMQMARRLKRGNWT